MKDQFPTKQNKPFCKFILARIHHLQILAWVGYCIILGLSCASASAATFNVSSYEQFSQAIDDANLDAELDIINLTSSFHYSGVASAITSLVTIEGNGYTIDRASGDESGSFCTLYIRDDAEVTIKNLTISGCESSGWGGALALNITSTDKRPTLTLENCLISHNTAMRSGGGIYAPYRTRLTLNNTVVTQNTARDGGGVALESAEGNFIDSEISHNTASATGGGILAETSALGWGATANFIRTTVENNTAQQGGGLAVRGDGSTINFDLSTSDWNLIQYNQAHDGGGIYAFNTSGGVNMGATDIQYNQVTGSGGGLFSADAFSLHLHYTNFNQNTAAESGGGIYYLNSSATTPRFESTSFTKNQATRGGGLFITGGETNMVLVNNTISSNIASETGGGVAVLGAQLTFNNSTIAANAGNDNTQANHAAGLYRNQADITLINSIIGDSIGGPDCALGGGGQIVADQNNVIENGDCVTSATAIDPMLGPLQIYTVNRWNVSGSTRAHAPLPESPAFEGGDINTCWYEDQRGEARNGLTCTLGAMDIAHEDQGNFFILPLKNGQAVIIPL